MIGGRKEVCRKKEEMEDEGRGSVGEKNLNRKREKRKERVRLRECQGKEGMRGRDGREGGREEKKGGTNEQINMERRATKKACWPIKWLHASVIYSVCQAHR